jgi:hypothetical protein
MDACCELLSQRLIDKSLPHYSAVADKGRGHDSNRKMRLTSWPSPLVPGMAVGLILDFEVGRSKALS